MKYAHTFLTVLVLPLALPGPAHGAEKKDPPARKSDKPAAATLTTRQGAEDLARYIDRVIDQRLQEEQVRASPRADDAEFLRRVYLDVTGHIPPADRARSFLDNRDPNKRARLIDELLASAEYGRHQADVWVNLLLSRNSDNRFVSFDPMRTWLEDNFNNGKPWDRMVRELLTASGEQDENGATTYFLANFGPEKITDNVTRMFLGVQLQCAQCHNHPFTDWKQTEYWGMAAFFTKLHRQGRPRVAAMNGTFLAIHEDGQGQPAPLPDSAKLVPAKFLQGEQPRLREGEPYRPVLADWLTAANNPYFSKAMVNRLWFQFFGRGLVQPVDAMHEGNPASHPQLLADLAAQFSAKDFDVKFLIRALLNTRAYQRTSKPSGNNADASPALFSRMAVKTFSPEQLFDSLVQVLGAPGRTEPRANLGKGPQGRVMAANPRAAFVFFFKGGDDVDPTEYQLGIPQALRLMNAPPLNNPEALAHIVHAGMKPEQVLDQLYLATLARRPLPPERERLLAYLHKHPGEHGLQAFGDVLWVLLNSSEFTLNH